MLGKLIKLANDLDARGLTKEADFLDQIILKKANLDIFKTPNMWAEKHNFELVEPKTLLEVVTPLMGNLGLSTSQEVVDYLLKNNYILPQNREWQPMEIQSKLDQALEAEPTCTPLTEDQIKSLEFANNLTIGKYSDFKLSDEVFEKLKNKEKVCEEELNTIELEAANVGLDLLVFDFMQTLAILADKVREEAKAIEASK